jgi:putative SOS response-associated peptidase YedK
MNMCGRFTIITDLLKVMERFILDEIPFAMESRHNVAPGQLRWGLVPSGKQDEKNGYRMINARAEALT